LVRPLFLFALHRSKKIIIWGTNTLHSPQRRVGFTPEPLLNKLDFAAIIIGCLPSFAVVYRSTVNSRRGYSQNYYNAHPNTHPHSKDVPLSNMSTASHTMAHGPDSTWDPENTVMSSSQEELAKPGKIAVTRSVQIEYEE
jgi:hypothetical protein